MHYPKNLLTLPNLITAPAIKPNPRIKRITIKGCVSVYLPRTNNPTSSKIWGTVSSTEIINHFFIQ